MKFESFYLEENFFTDFVGFVKKSLSVIVNKIKTAFESLFFGETKTISFATFGGVNEAKASTKLPGEKNDDEKSRIGYYAERVTAHKLCEHLVLNGYKIRNVDNLSELTIERERYKVDKLNIISDTSKISIAESQGVAIADAMFDEIKNSADSAICVYDIRLTGESEKFKHKADMIVTKYKKNKVVDEIFASLKVYSSTNINMVNATFISFIKKLMFPNIEGTGETFIDNLLSEYGKDGKMKSQLKNFKNVSSMAKEYIKKKNEFRPKSANYSKMATDYMNAKDLETGLSRYETIRDFTIELFNVMYAKNKKEVNDNLVKLLGLEAEDIYIAVAKNNKIDVMSSRTSKEFKELVSKLSEEFTIKMVRGEGLSFNMVLYDTEGNSILGFKVPMKEEGKMNLWMDFKMYFPH